MFLRIVTVKSKDIILSEIFQKPVPEHVAIIMDGNRRWARNKGLFSMSGHDSGVENIKNIVMMAIKTNVKILTLYAFSNENWGRDIDEVSYLMLIARNYFDSDSVNDIINQGVKIIAIGNIDRFDRDIVDKIRAIEEKTKSNEKMVLFLALSYSGKNEIVEMVRSVSKKVANKDIDIEKIDSDVVTEHMYLSNYPEPDLLIRTGGDLRVSNFLLWYLSYTELYFTKKMWPEFDGMDFLLAIKDYQLRERRYGLL